MDVKTQKIYAKSVYQQRNALLILFVLAMAYGLAVTVVLYRQNTTVVLVPGIRNTYTLNSSGSYNITYLEDMAVAVAYNFLTVSKDSFAYNKRKILEMTYPGSAGQVQNILQQTYNILSARRINTVFRPSRIDTFADTNTVKITGFFTKYIGEKQVSTAEKIYQIQFISQGMTLYLKSFKEVKNAETSQ